jgi:hypothetical protein
MKATRQTLTIPDVIKNKVEEYQETNGIPTFTTALLELVRKGLESSK